MPGLSALCTARLVLACFACFAAATPVVGQQNTGTFSLPLVSDGPDALPTPASEPMFRARPGTIIAGAPHVLSVDGAGETTAIPVRFEALPGEGFMAVSFRCGLILIPEDGRVQFLTTIGSGDTELLNCSGLIAMGRLETRDHAERIGLIYDVTTPGGAGAGPVLLRWDVATRVFVLDEETAEALDERAAVALDSLENLSSAIRNYMTGTGN